MTEKPRVFHLITRLLKGGAEAKTIATVQGLEDYEFTVGYGAEYDPDQVAALEEDGIQTQQFRTIRHYNPVTTVPAVLSVARYLRKHEFDLVHTHSTEAGIIGRFAAALAGTPAVVHTVHGVPFADDRNDLLERFILACERAAAPRTDRIVTNADAIADDYLRRGIGQQEQYTTVYSGIDLEQFRDVTPAADVDGDGVRILMVGRLADGKGFDVLLDAVEQLATDDLSVYLVGDGPQKTFLEREIDRRGLAETVSMLGYRSDVPAIMAACDVFVLPSYREGTPRVITEAMASGLPVVATDIAGIPEQVADGESGYLIEPGDDAALANRLEALLASREQREALGAVGRKRVERFSDTQMLADLDAVYREVLGLEPADTMGSTLDIASDSEPTDADATTTPDRSESQPPN
ncbi:glycosyltransferase family 4 protein [Natronorubrum bangense]|uniref:Group 1 glycosyl transferase n=1 Tax=Natronorubrum bangense JCM 10635 TaxID=1227500 RepID=L9W021_9EURY|nr:glycosyltransferase family 4 protein [Natronorubrum bangense]ELY42667.1 group 1 glycosyl transferase [Natronorubrum bangense JCM 10635]